MQIRQIPIFQADLFVRKGVGTPQQIADIIDQILIAKKLNPAGDPDSNEGCWREMYCCEDIDWLIKEITDLYHEVDEFYRSKDRVYNQTEKGKLEIAYWANVNSYGSRNVFHSHKPAHFSAVYYLQAEGTGGLRLLNPANILVDANRTAPFVTDFNFLPSEGDLIMFPSWVPHEVETNLSDKDRINLTFDIKIGKK